MMVLGQITLHIAANPNVGYIDFEGLYVAIALGFLIMVSMKLFLFDVGLCFFLIAALSLI